MLVFVSKRYLLLAKSLSLFSLLFFLNLILGWSLPAASFGTFVNKDYIKNLISSFAPYSFSYIIDLLIITNCSLWDVYLKVLYYLICISYEDLFLYLYIIWLISLLFWYICTSKTAKKSDITDILFFLVYLSSNIIAVFLSLAQLIGSQFYK